MLLSLASTGVARAAEALTFLINNLMNSWKRLLFGGAIRARADTGPEAGLKAGRLIAGLLRWTRGRMMVEGGKTKCKAKIKQEELSCLLNRLSEPLDKSFYNCKNRSINQQLVSLLRGEILSVSGEAGVHMQSPVISDVIDHAIS